jgi:hypothetical protein
MANQLSGQTGASPREYNSHQRYAKFARVRYANQSVAFLAAQATRLTLTSAQVFAKLTKNTAAQIVAAATSGSLS